MQAELGGVATMPISVEEASQAELTKYLAKRMPSKSSVMAGQYEWRGHNCLSQVCYQ